MSRSTRAAEATATYRVKLRKECEPRRRRPPAKPTAHIPRVARLLALAHKIDGMIRSGELKDWAGAARLIGVTRARMTQIANLILLSPMIQDFILCSPFASFSQSPTNEHDLRFIVTHACWDSQWQLWVRLLPH